MPGGRPSLFEERSPKFLEQIEKGLPIRAAAALAGLTPTTAMNWLAAGREQKRGKFFDFFEHYTRARGAALAKSIERIRNLGREDWRSEFALAERMFPKDLGKPELQLNLQNNTQVNVANGFVITVEKSQQLEQRTLALEAKAQKLLDRDVTASKNGD